MIRFEDSATTIRPKPYLYRGTTSNGVELIIDFRRIAEDASLVRREPKQQSISVEFLHPSDVIQFTGSVADSFWRYLNACIEMAPHIVITSEE